MDLNQSQFPIGHRLDYHPYVEQPPSMVESLRPKKISLSHQCQTKPNVVLIHIPRIFLHKIILLHPYQNQQIPTRPIFRGRSIHHYNHLGHNHLQLLHHLTMNMHQPYFFPGQNLNLMEDSPSLKH